MLCKGSQEGTAAIQLNMTFVSLTPIQRIVELTIKRFKTCRKGKLIFPGDCKKQ